MIVRTALCAFAVMAAAPVSAEPLRLAQAFPTPARPLHARDAAPYHEIRLILGARGLRPVSRPHRIGRNFVLRAIDRNGDMLRVFVDVEFERILAVQPITDDDGPRYMPGSRFGALPPDLDGDDLPPPPRSIPNARGPHAARQYDLPPAPPLGYRNGAPSFDDDDEFSIEALPRRPRGTQRQAPAGQRPHQAMINPQRLPMPRPRPAAPASPAVEKPNPAQPPAATATAAPAPAPSTTGAPTAVPKTDEAKTAAPKPEAGKADTFPPFAPLE